MPASRCAQWCTILAAIVLGACTTEPPPIPPEELQTLTPKERLDTQWKKSGFDTGRSQLQPWPMDDALFVAARDGVVQRLDKSSGKRTWSVNVKRILGAGITGDDAQIYFSTEDGEVFSLDAQTGEQLWTQKASSEVLSPAVAGFGAVVVRSADGRVVALEPDTGAVRWSASFTPPALTLNGYSSPVVVEGGVLLGLDDGRVIAMALDTGRVIWESIVSVPSGRSEVERLVDIDGDIQIDDEAIYVANYRGRLVRIEPGQGNVQWSTPMSSTAGVLVGSDHVYVVNEEDAVLEVDKATGRIGWEQKALRGRKLTRPVFVDENTLLVADFEGYTHLIDAVTGELVGRSRVGRDAIQTTPTQVDDITFIQSTDGAVAAVRLR